MAHIIMTAWPP